MTLKLLIEYDGTAYGGWQRQANAPSVQAAIEDALTGALGRPVTVIGAGRTDAGVHASGQVAHVVLDGDVPMEKLPGIFRGTIPPDIVIRSFEIVPDGFHARHSAKRRTYEYTITLERRAIGRRYSWFVPYRIDTELLQQAAFMIVGEHDFTAISKLNRDQQHHRCTVVESRWDRDGPLLRYRIVANRFVYGMVRALVGLMVDVGRGKHDVAVVQQLLDTPDRALLPSPLAPARGLVLVAVEY
jgi:tRNA pseudouridine38-40 synthase